MEPTDTQLARQWARRGERGALRTLYERHAEAVHAFARGMAGPDAAQDILQDTFFRAARAMDQYRNRAKFSTWLLKIARNAAWDHGRRLKRRVRDVERESPSPAAPGPDEAMALGERQAAVRRAVLALPDDQRAAITLCNLQELPLREVAEILDWRIEKLKSVLFRARRRLRKDLEAYV